MNKKVFDASLGVKTTLSRRKVNSILEKYSDKLNTCSRENKDKVIESILDEEKRGMGPIAYLFLSFIIRMFLQRLIDKLIGN